MSPKTDDILESSLYVSDLPRSVRFYEETFGFRVISDFGERGCAMHADTHQVLLLFKKGGSRAIQSPHDGDGELHVAFAIPADELPTGNPGSKREESRWKKSGSGNWGLEPLLSKPGPPFDRTGHAGCNHWVSGRFHWIRFEVPPSFVVAVVAVRGGGYPLQNTSWVRSSPSWTYYTYYKPFAPR